MAPPFAASVTRHIAQAANNKKNPFTLVLRGFMLRERLVGYDTSATHFGYNTSLAWSARRERSPRARVTWPLCDQPLKRSTT
jgi:hypothetical protein